MSKSDLPNKSIELTLKLARATTEELALALEGIAEELRLRTEELSCFNSIAITDPVEPTH